LCTDLDVLVSIRLGTQHRTVNWPPGAARPRPSDASD